MAGISLPGSIERNCGETVKMPLYDYRCEACGHELEVIQKMGAAALRDCPACGEPKLKKQVSAAAFRLKGGGWYETDFKGGNKKNIHEPGGSQPDKSPGQDAKPAANKEAAPPAKTTG